MHDKARDPWKAMKVVITGGLGFLGQELAALVQAEWHDVTSLVLVDAVRAPLKPALEGDARVSVRVEDITAAGFWERVVDTPGMSVFHLAAIMSGHGEQDFELCMRVNHHALLGLLEQCRRVAERAGGGPESLVRVTFTSTGAVFGPLPLVTDDTKPMPQTTYGTTKAMAELLLNDYSRKGFLDGRGARLPTVIVRPGKPNGASTSVYSGIVREPLSGVDVTSPVSGDLAHAVSHYRTIIAGILKLHLADRADVERVLGHDRVVNLPSFSATLKQLHEALVRVVTEDGGPVPVDKLGKADFSSPDPRLNAIVSSMMSATDSERALKLGLPESPPVDTCIREYIADFYEPPLPKTVGFIGCGWMGSGMIGNLANKGGFDAVVICNRTRAKAEALAAKHGGVIRVVDTPAEVAAAADVVCTCLASESQSDEVFFSVGAGGLARALTPAHVVMDHSTVSPACTARLREAAAKAGAGFVDAPISGGPEGAAAGTLAVMCGGDEATYRAVAPVLKLVGTTVKRMGGPGAGTATKLVNQLLVGAHAAASAEALRLAKSLGVTDFPLLLSVLDKSWGQSRVLARCGGFVSDAEAKADPTVLHTSGAPMRNLLKDLTFVQRAAQGVGLRTPVADTACAGYQAAADAGLAEADIAILYNTL